MTLNKDEACLEYPLLPLNFPYNSQREILGFLLK